MGYIEDHPHTQQRREYSACVALSNAAVSLLQYNSCVEACQTFRDAIEVLEMNTGASSSGAVPSIFADPQEQPIRWTLINEKLERASVRLASVRSKISHDPVMPLMVISSTIHPKVLSHALDIPLPPDSILVVRMEGSWECTNHAESSTSTYTSTMDSHQQLLLAALNYNMAAALRYQFLMQQETTITTIGEDLSVSLLTESFSVLNRRIDQQLSFLWTETLHTHAKELSLSLGLLTLRSLVQISFELNAHADEIRNYNHRLFDVHKRIAQLPESMILQEACTDFMAPAA